MVELEVIVQGDADCTHPFVGWLSVPMDGHMWQCDEASCKRHVRLAYSEQTAQPSSLAFPQHAYVRRLDAQADEVHYLWRANQEGVIEKYLPRNEILSFPLRESAFV